MAKIIGLPKLSPTMEEGTLVSWVKSEGDEVDVDDLLAEVETDKATMEFRSFDRGVILKILVAEGETLAPDVPVAIIGKKGEDISALLEQVKSGAGGAPTGAAKTGKVAKAPTIKEAAAPPPWVDQTGAPGSTPARAPGSRLLSSPLVRRLAREQGIDLQTVAGSGPRGRIVKRDIESHQPGSGSATAAASTAAAGSTWMGQRPPPRIEKASGMRRTIARRLTESKQTVPHYYLTIDIDASPIVRARRAMNKELEKDGDKVSINDLIIKAAATSLRRMPSVNASWAGDAIHYHQVVDVSVAVAIPDGLVTPVIRDADRQSVVEISRQVRELAGRAKNKRLKPEEMTDGTFSVSNLGMFGIEEFAAVINPPEGAILAVGTVRDEPVVQDGAVVPGQRMRMTLSCDHRVIDGALGAQFLALLKRTLEAPLNMLL